MNESIEGPKTKVVLTTRALRPSRRWVAVPALLLALFVLPGLSAQERVEARHDLTPNARLSVSGVHHDITVRVWDRNEVHVVAMIDGESERLEVTGSADNLSVRIEHDRQQRGQVRGNGSIEVQIPRGVRLSLNSVSGSQQVEGVTGTLRLSTVSGRIEYAGDAESAEINSVSGSVRGSGAVSRTNVNSVAGSVELRGVSGRVDANSVSGNMTFAGGPFDHVRANSVSGRVELDGRVNENASMDLQSHSGAIVLKLPANTPGDYEIDTMSGRIVNRITDDEARSPRYGPGRSLNFRVGAGTASIRLHSFSGSVTVEPR